MFSDVNSWPRLQCVFLYVLQILERQLRRRHKGRRVWKRNYNFLNFEVYCPKEHFGISMNYHLSWLRSAAAIGDGMHNAACRLLGRWLSVPLFSRLTIAARIIAIVLTFAVPLNLVIFAVIWHVSEAAIETQRASLLYTARSVAAAADAKLGEYMALAQALARSPALLEENLDSFEAEARRIFASAPDAWVVVADLAGQQLINTASQPGRPLPVRNAIGLAAQKRAFETRSAIISDVQHGTVSQSWIVGIDVPIFKNGRPVCALAIGVRAQSFFRLLNDQQIPKNWLAAIVDREHRFIARVPGNDRYTGQLASESWRKVKDQDGVFEPVSLEGDLLVNANAHSPVSGWLIGIAVKKSEMQAAAWNTIRWATIPGGGFSVLSLLFAGAIARSITRPIEELRRRASVLVVEPAPAMPLRGPPEVNELYQALRQSAAKRKRSDQTLRESEEKLRLAMDAAKLGIWRWDKGTGTKELQWDNRCRALFGVAPDARVTYETWANAILPEDRDRTQANVARALDPGDPHDDTVCEFRVRHPDGTVLWLSSTGRAFFEPDPASPSGRRVVFKSGAVRDVTDVRAAEAALRASEERFRGIYEHAGTGIAIVDLEGRFQSCNPAYSKMLGYSEEELRDLHSADIQHPDDRNTNAEEVRLLVEEKIPSFEIVNRYLGKDGKSIWVHKYVSLLRDPSGTPTHRIGLVTDITERKRQEDQIALLMREVNHLSKNMLTLVQAIARQTLAANTEDFLDRFGRRIEALAAGQDLLVKNAWKGVGLNELIRSQLAPFEDLIGTRIGLEGQDIFVSAHAAQAIGMALHELATNAGKYGALSGADGRVDIAWQLQRGEKDEAIFVMTWREQAAHPVRAPAKLGFGSSVICKLAEMSLGARVELCFAVTGLTWQLRCAAEEVWEGSLRTASAV
jgi:PAS domain S-box-containing protein